MAVTFRAMGSVAQVTPSPGANDLAISVPAGIQNGDKLLVFFSTGDFATFSDHALNDGWWPHWPWQEAKWPIDTLPAGWTLLSLRARYYLGLLVAGHDVTDAGSEPASYTFSLGSNELDVPNPGAPIIGSSAGVMVAYSGAAAGFDIGRDDDPSYEIGTHAPDHPILLDHDYDFDSPPYPLLLDPFTTTEAGEMRLFFSAISDYEPADPTLTGWTLRFRQEVSFGEHFFLFENPTATVATYSGEELDTGLGYATWQVYDYISLLPAESTPPDPPDPLIPGTILSYDFTHPFPDDWDIIDTPDPAYVPKPSIWDGTMPLPGDEGVVKVLPGYYSHLRLGYFWRPAAIAEEGGRANLFAFHHDATEMLRVDFIKDSGFAIVLPGFDPVTVSFTDRPAHAVIPPVGKWIHIGLDVNLENNYATLYLNGIACLRARGVPDHLTINAIEMNRAMDTETDIWDGVTHVNTFYLDNAYGRGEAAPGALTNTTWSEDRYNGEYLTWTANAESNNYSAFPYPGHMANAIVTPGYASAYAYSMSGESDHSASWTAHGLIWTKSRVEFDFYRGAHNNAPGASPYTMGIFTMRCGHLSGVEEFVAAEHGPVLSLVWNATDSTLALWIGQNAVTAVAVADTVIPYASWAHLRVIVKMNSIVGGTGYVAVYKNELLLMNYAGDLTAQGGFITEITFAPYISATDVWDSADQPRWDNINLYEIVEAETWEIPPSLDYLLLGETPETLKKLVVLFEGFEEGLISQDSRSANTLSGTLLAQEGTMPYFWRGVCELALDPIHFGEEYWTLPDLRALWRSSNVFYFINQFANAEMGHSTEGVALRVVWLEGFNPVYYSSAHDLAYISFLLIEVL